MEKEMINVGIIGGSLNNQWASKTHIPILNKSPHFNIVAIGTSHMDSAIHSAREFEAPFAYTNYKDMAQNPHVDLIVVSIKVPFHYEACMAAIQEGKHIYCEWPLGLSTSQSENLYKQAIKHNVHHAIGFQARQSPEINFVKKAIEKGEIGRIISCTMQVSTFDKGNVISEKSEYLLKETNGANLLTIHGGHSLDTLCYLLGDFKSLSAVTKTIFAESRIYETGKFTKKDTDDQILIHGELEGGVMASIHIQGGVFPELNITIKGEQGAFRISQRQSVGHIQFGNLVVEKISPINQSFAKYSHEVVMESEGEDKTIRGNVKHAYEMLHENIRTKKQITPNFSDAVKTHKIIDYIRCSAKTGEKININSI